MTWHQVASLEELKKQGRMIVEVNSQKILLIMQNNKPHAVAAKCPHLGLSLAKASINDQQEIVCPFHKSAFDLCSGEVKCWAPWPKVLAGVFAKFSKPKALTVFELKIDNDQIAIQL